MSLRGKAWDPALVEAFAFAASFPCVVRRQTALCNGIYHANLDFRVDIGIDCINPAMANNLWTENDHDLCSHQP